MQDDASFLLVSFAEYLIGLVEDLRKTEKDLKLLHSGVDKVRTRTDRIVPLTIVTLIYMQFGRRW